MATAFRYTQSEQTPIVVILAGGTIEVAPGQSIKPHEATIGRCRLMPRTIETWRLANHRVWVVAPEDSPMRLDPDCFTAVERWITSGASLTQSVTNAWEQLPMELGVVLTTVDTPFLTRDTAESIVHRAYTMPRYRVEMGYTSNAQLRQTYPGIKKSTIRLKDQGKISPANVVLTKGVNLNLAEQFMGQLIAARKSALRAAKIFGTETLLLGLRAKLGLLPPELCELEMAISRVIGVEIRGYHVNEDIAFDVDNPRRWDLAKKLWPGN